MLYEIKENSAKSNMFWIKNEAPGHMLEEVLRTVSNAQPNRQVVLSWQEVDLREPVVQRDSG